MRKHHPTNLGFDIAKTSSTTKDTSKSSPDKSPETAQYEVPWIHDTKRGIEKVKIEYNLVCTAHNLKVIWGKLERNVPVIGTIRTLVAISASKVGNFVRLHPIRLFN